MVKIESAFLDSDQEQKLNNVLSLAEEKGNKIDIRRVQVSPELKKIRVLLAGMAAQAYLQFWNDVFGLNARESRVVTEFAAVAQEVIHKSATGNLVFVAEKDEK